MNYLESLTFSCRSSTRSIAVEDSEFVKGSVTDAHTEKAILLAYEK